MILVFLEISLISEEHLDSEDNLVADAPPYPAAKKNQKTPILTLFMVLKTFVTRIIEHMGVDQVQTIQHQIEEVALPEETQEEGTLQAHPGKIHPKVHLHL